MRHFVFRIIMGIIWIVAAVVNVLMMNIAFAALYLLVGIAFLYSAYHIWKNMKKNWRE